MSSFTVRFILLSALLAIISTIVIDAYRHDTQVGPQPDHDESLHRLLVDQEEGEDRQPFFNPVQAKGRKTSREKPRHLESNPYYHRNEIRSKRSVVEASQEASQEAGQQAGVLELYKKTLTEKRRLNRA